ncbi:MAG: Spy/CpxP family protein refolding chaperone [Armatimonadetes bacterium]|nr:Spy/CpxP family protein refolding chaperone [Armatimonadota bacterium]
MRMKITLIITVLLFAFALCALAQNPSKQGKLAMRAAKHGRFAQLNLTSAQKTEIKGIKQAARVEVKAVKANTSLTRQDRRQNIMQIKQDSIAKIRALLTDEQKAKFNKIMRHRAQRVAALGRPGKNTRKNSFK